MSKILVKNKIEFHLDIETMTFFTKDVTEDIKHINIGQVMSIKKDNHIEYVIVTNIDDAGVWGVLYNKVVDVDARRKQCQKTFFDM